MKKVEDALSLPNVTVHAWSDSTVTLDWICGNPQRWKSSVANRVTCIQELIAPSELRILVPVVHVV